MRVKLKTSGLWWAGMVFWVGMFIFVGWKNLDPDFGWHVRVGDYIYREGIPKTDPFTYSMPSYPFIDHEWLTNVLMSRILELWGYAAEAAVFGILAGVLYWLVFPGKKTGYALVPVLMGAGAWLSRGGVRPQILDWIFLAGLLKLVWKDETWIKWRWGVLPLFALWANLHGGFAIGPVVLAVILVLKAWEKRNLDKADIWVWLGGVAATWINPYGPRLWHEVWMQVTDTHLRWSVAEWQPFWVRAELGVWLLAALGWAILTVTKYRPEKWKLGVTAGLILAGLSSLRHISLTVVMLVLVCTDLIEVMAEKIKRDKLSWSRARKFYLLIVLIAAIVFAEEAGVMIWRTAGGQSGITYPIEAVEYLKTRSFAGEVFSEYGWGGYLLWKYPEKKVFMDGRMPSWRWVSPEGESDWAFKDYIKIRDEGNFREEFDKYGVGVVLWPLQDLKGEIPEENKGWWAKLMRIGIGNEPVDLADKLQEAGWKEVYRDETAVIYIKP